MDLLDIPAQVERAFRLSTRSWKTFAVSLILAMLGCGLAFDLAYAFFYTRVFNTQNPEYGAFYWAALCTTAFAIPAAATVREITVRRSRLRPFDSDVFGVAVAPFDVASFDLATLSASDRGRALEGVTNEFFAAARNLVQDQEWTRDFAFRVLPPSTRVATKQDAETLRKSLGATLLIWGLLVQSDSGYVLNMRLTGHRLDMTVSGPMDPFFPASSLAIWSLLSAELVLEERGDVDKARRYLELAHKPAGKLDAMAKGGADKGLSRIIQQRLQSLQENAGN